jgi:hypothetical protein
MSKRKKYCRLVAAPPNMKEYGLASRESESNAVYRLFLRTRDSGMQRRIMPISSQWETIGRAPPEFTLQMERARNNELMKQAFGVRYLRTSLQLGLLLRFDRRRAR